MSNRIRIRFVLEHIKFSTFQIHMTFEEKKNQRSDYFFAH